MSPVLTLGVVGAVLTLVVLFEMLRRQRLREKYALIWVVVALGTVLLVVFPGLLTQASDLLGVQVPANLLFFVASMLLVSWEEGDVPRLFGRGRRAEATGAA